jgi:plastocyanin
MDSVRIGRRLVAVMVLGIVLAACGDRGVTASGAAVPAGPATITVRAGEVEAGHPEREFLGFYPAALTAHPGDTLRLVNHSAATPHTVAFGVAADRSDQPALIDPGVGFTPITAAPCVSAQAVTATTAACPGAPPARPAPSGQPSSEVPLPAAYSAQPFYNSGILLPGQTAVLSLSPSLMPGGYHVVCLLHPTMAATVIIVPHIVVLGSPIALLDPRNFGAPTVPTGSDYAGGEVVSGLFGGTPFPTDSYSLRFPTAGTYPYTCSIHAGMRGVVQVH